MLARTERGGGDSERRRCLGKRFRGFHPSLLTFFAAQPFNPQTSLSDSLSLSISSHFTLLLFTQRPDLTSPKSEKSDIDLLESHESFYRIHRHLPLTNSTLSSRSLTRPSDRTTYRDPLRPLDRYETISDLTERPPRDFFSKASFPATIYTSTSPTRPTKMPADKYYGFEGEHDCIQRALCRVEIAELTPIAVTGAFLPSQIKHSSASMSSPRSSQSALSLK